jgi:hypothetical protein
MSRNNYCVRRTEYFVTCDCTCVPLVQVCDDKVWGRVIPARAMKAYGRVEVWLCLFLSLSLDGDEQSVFHAMAQALSWSKAVTKFQLIWFLQRKTQQDATVYQNFIIPWFKWSSTCFGRHTAHHQEPKTALAASGFAMQCCILLGFSL